MKYIILILLIFPNVEYSKSTHINNHFRKIVEKYEREFKIKVDVAIYFDDTYQNEGRCSNDGDIHISKKHWSQFNKYQREILIYRELTNCIYTNINTNNNYSYWSDSKYICPQSILTDFKVMGSLQSYKCYGYNRKLYIKNIMSNI